ncbi:hypothetical protein V2J09_006069 [Rumex salicifolius]
MASKAHASGDNSSQTQYDRKSDLVAFESNKTGVKGLVDSGIKKIPRIFLNTMTATTASCSPPTALITGVPIIDLHGIRRSEERKKVVVSQMKKACSEWGFFQVINHGVPLTVLDGIVDGVRRFHEMEEGLKKPYYSRELSRRDIMFEYTKEMKRVGVEVLEIMSEGLGLRPDHLKDLDIAEGIYVQGHYYPACPEPELAIGTSSHADNCFFTILLQDNTGGLQILHDNQWVDVDPLPGALVLITNDEFKSVIHRVLAKGVGPRISVPCFFRTHFDQAEEDIRVYGPIKELLSDDNPAKYRETTVIEYLKHYYGRGLVGTSALSHFELQQS